MSALRKGWCPGALRPMAAKDGLLVRLRLTCGILPAATAHALAELGTRFGNGLFDLSTRGNLQMRGVRESTLPALRDDLQALGLLDSSAGAESVRNVLASPLAGLHGGIDIRPLVAALERRLVEDDALHTLPGKFGFLIDDGTWPSLAGIGADVRFDWTGKRFAISVAGTREEAAPIGNCAAVDLVTCAAALAERALALFARYQQTRRMRHLMSVLGARSLAEALARDPSPACGRRASPGPDPGWSDEGGSDEGDSRLSCLGPTGIESPHPTPSDDGPTFSRKRERDVARDIVGLQSIDDPGIDATTSWLGLAAPFGRLDAKMLSDAAAVARQSPFAELRLTPWRVLLLPGVERLAQPIPGFIADPADPRLSVAACVGAAGCAQGSTDTQADAAALAMSLPASPGIALHVSGCEKGCAKPSRTPLTLVAHDGRYDLVRNGKACDQPVQHGLDLAAARAVLALEIA